MKPVLPHICIALKKYYHNVDEKKNKNKFTLGEQSLVQTCRCFLTYCKTAKRSAYVYKNNENMQWILKVCWKTSALNTQGVFVKVFFFSVTSTLPSDKYKQYCRFSFWRSNSCMKLHDYTNPSISVLLQLTLYNKTSSWSCAQCHYTCCVQSSSSFIFSKVDKIF